MRHGLRVRLGVVLFALTLLTILGFRASFAAPVPIEALSIDPAWVPRNTAPASAPATIRGIGFTPSTTVNFDGVAATVTFVNSRTLQVLVPTSATGKVSTVNVANGGDTDEIFPFFYTDSICYVKPTGNDSGNCLTPAAAKKTIGGAITEARPMRLASAPWSAPCSEGLTRWVMMPCAAGP